MGLATNTSSKTLRPFILAESISMELIQTQSISRFLVSGATKGPGDLGTSGQWLDQSFAHLQRRTVLRAHAELSRREGFWGTAVAAATVLLRVLRRRSRRHVVAPKGLACLALIQICATFSALPMTKRPSPWGMKLLWLSSKGGGAGVSLPIRPCPPAHRISKVRSGEASWAGLLVPHPRHQAREGSVHPREARYLTVACIGRRLDQCQGRCCCHSESSQPELSPPPTSRVPPSHLPPSLFSLVSSSLLNFPDFVSSSFFFFSLILPHPNNFIALLSFVVCQFPYRLD